MKEFHARMLLTASLRTSPTPSINTSVDFVLFKWFAIVCTVCKWEARVPATSMTSVFSWDSSTSLKSDRLRKEKKNRKSITMRLGLKPIRRSSLLSSDPSVRYWIGQANNPPIIRPNAIPPSNKFVRKKKKETGRKKVVQGENWVYAN